MNKNYSVSEVAKMLGYSSNSIYGFLKEGLIKAERIGNGKFRIPEKEIAKFTEPNKNTSKLKPRKEPEQKSNTADTIPQSVLLPAPRPGMSLADLGGEPVIHTLKLWFEERVGLPKLFDWLTSLSSIIIGVSLFLYSGQLDVLSVGSLSLWLNPVRLGMIFGGFGLILSSMIQGEIGRFSNFTNYFRYFLGMTFLGLSVILLLGGETDGFLIHGLFGLIILIEASSNIDSAILYMMYIFGLLISVFVVLNFIPDNSSLSLLSTDLRPFFGSNVWIVSLLLIILLAAGLYSFIANKKFLNSVLFVYGFLLCVLALLYGARNFWTRSFSFLIAGLIGLMLPYWQAFKAKAITDRPLVFKLFGAILMSFGMFIIFIAMIQGVLVSNTNRVLVDKADLAKVQIANTLTDLEKGANYLATNASFVDALAKGRTEELTNQLKFLSLGKTDVAIAGIIDTEGVSLANYPSSSIFSGSDFSSNNFFTTVSKSSGC